MQFILQSEGSGCCQLTGAQLLVNRVNKTFFKAIVLVRFSKMSCVPFCFFFFFFLLKRFLPLKHRCWAQETDGKGRGVCAPLLSTTSFSSLPFFSFGLSSILPAFALSPQPHNQTCSRAPKFLRAIRHPPLSLSLRSLSLSQASPVLSLSAIPYNFQRAFLVPTSQRLWLAHYETNNWGII